MADLKQLEKELENIAGYFLKYSKEERDTSLYRTYKNKLAGKLWSYAKEIRRIKYSDIEDFDFEDSISETIISCLNAYKNGDSIIRLFKTSLKKNIFKFKTKESKNGMAAVSYDVIRLGRELEKWASYKGLSQNISRRNAEIDEKLFDYGRSWGKSDNQIKKALDWLDKKCFIKGNDNIGDDDSESERFDLISKESLFGFDGNFESRKQKFLLYVKAADDEYESRSNNVRENPRNLTFYSKYFTNLIFAALLKENYSNTNIGETLAGYAIIDKDILADFQTNQNWSPNTNRKDIGRNCGINENNIGNIYDRFKNEVMAKYKNFLKEEELI
ncbi:MAG: hypothetical protein J6Y16_09140 [Treponema sp.]|nr:hypothetical protein [Treponema sp.]